MKHFQKVSFHELEGWLKRLPVIADVNSLLPLCLSDDVNIVTDSSSFAESLDNYDTYLDGQYLILDQNSSLQHRFPAFEVNDLPDKSLINKRIAKNLDYARNFLLTSHKVAQRIEVEVSKSKPDVVILLLVDGLSYEDIHNWDCDAIPCFVDGPSVTYRFVDKSKKKLVEKVGFASIVNRPSVYRRLYDIGYHKAIGYTYWEPDSNVIADYMFAGIPFTRVNNFTSITNLLEAEIIKSRTFVQIVREGLDGLAHSKRELRPALVESEIKSLKSDITRLLEVISKKNLRATVYMTSDHGILWNYEHNQEFEVISNMAAILPRLASTRPTLDWERYCVRMETENIPYYPLKYPFLGRRIKSNDNGVHGGISYQESIVPFAKFEV